MLNFWLIKLLTATFKRLMNFDIIFSAVSDKLQYILMGVIFAWLKLTTYYEFYCYFPQGKRFIETITTMTLMSPIIMLLVVFVRDYYPIDGGIVWLVFVLIFPVQEYISGMYKMNLDIANDKFWNRIIAMYYLINKKSYNRNDFVMVRGFILSYLSTCKSIEIVKTISNITTAFTDNIKSMELQKVVLTKILEAEFDKRLEELNRHVILDKYRHEKVMLAKAHYLIEICKRNKNAIVLLSNLNISTLGHEFYHYTLIKLAEQFKYNTGRKGREQVVLKVLRRELELRELLLIESEFFSNLWEYVSINCPSISTIKNMVQRALVAELESKLVWKDIISFNIPVSSIYTLYILHIELIHGDQMQSKRFRGIQKELERNSRKHNDMIEFANFNDLSTPLAFLSADIRNIGIVQRVNLAFCRMFGVLSKEIVGTHTEVLLSQVYKAYLKDYLSQVLTAQQKNSNLREDVFARHKNGYIFPIKAKLQQVTFIGEEAQLIVTYEFVKETKENIYMITDKAFRVVDVSEGANTFLGISRKVVKFRKIYAHHLCPELVENGEICNDSSKKVMYYFPLYSLEELEYYNILSPYYNDYKHTNASKATKSNNNLLHVDEEHGLMINAKVKSIDFGNSGRIGYVFIFETCEPFRAAEEIKISKPIANNFVFKYNEEYGTFFRDYVESIKPAAGINQKRLRMQACCAILRASTRISKCFCNVIAGKIIKIKSHLQKNDLQEFSEDMNKRFKNVNYEQNIKTYRINDFKKEIDRVPALLFGDKYETVDDSGRSAGNQLLKKQGEEARIRELLHNREQTRSYVVDNYKMSNKLKFLFLVISILNIGCIAIGVINNVALHDAKNDIKILLDQTTGSFQRAQFLIESSLLLSFNSFAYMQGRIQCIGDHLG